MCGLSRRRILEFLGVANGSGNLPPDPAAPLAASLAQPVNSLTQPGQTGSQMAMLRSEPASTSTAPVLESLNPTPAALQREAAVALLAERRRSGTIPPAAEGPTGSDHWCGMLRENRLAGEGVPWEQPGRRRRRWLSSPSYR